MTGRAIPSNFVKNVLQNGVGRYICQLQRLTLTFCKSHGGSGEMRNFIENHVLDFTNNNPGIVVYLKPRRHRAPAIVGEYLNGDSKKISAAQMSAEEIAQWVEFMRTRSGVPIVRLRQNWHTDSPSIQGIWHPFLNKDPALNTTQLPSRERSQIPAPPSATDRLLEMARELREQENKES